MNVSKKGNIPTGRIIRLLMKNFLTYNKIEVYPGPNLNIVFGPNGSGKSSILCAICIVLGGKPEYTGRGKDVKDYIKHGEEKAEIEIELFQSNRNVIIKRIITQSGKNIFYLQGAETTQKQILEKVNKYGICINNLCQFLPQDRVSEFAKLNKIQLLFSTIRAIGEAQLADQHQTLCEKGKNVDEITNQILNFQKQLDCEIAKNSQLEDQVKAIQTEKTLDKLIKQLKGLHLLRLYLASRKELKDEMEPLTANLFIKIQTLKKTIKPMQDTEETIQNKIIKERDSIKQLSSDVSKLELQGKRNNERFRQCHIDIENEESDFQAYQSSCNQRIREVNDLKHTILAMEGHLESQDDVNEQELKNEVKLLTGKISALSEKSSNFKRQSNEYTYTLVAERNRRGQMEHTLVNLKDSKERRLKQLLHHNDGSNREKFRATYQAASWIVENNNKFEGPIHGPLYTVIDMNKMDFGKYLENTVSNNDLIAFVCESKNDVNLLKKYADSFHWPINILHSKPSPMNEYLPNVPIERLRKIGFEIYLKECINAPQAVISYLCSVYQIQNIPIAKSADFSSVPDCLSCFFIGEDRYDKSISKYDGASSTSISALNPINFITINSNEEDLKKAQNEMANIVKRIEDIQQLKQDIISKEEYIEKELEVFRREKQQLQNKLQLKLQLIAKIGERRKQLARREEEVIDISGAELKMKTKIKVIIGELMKLGDQLVMIREERSSKILQFFHNSLTLESAKQEKQQMGNDMESLQSQITDTENDHAVQKENELKLKKELRRLYNDLCSHLECSVEELKKPGSKVIEELEYDHKEKSLEEINQLLADSLARKECLISPSGNVLEDYNKRERQIKKIEEEIASKSTYVENCQTNLEEAKSQWLPKMEQLTEQISQHFSSFMKHLGCAGLVSLDKGANEKDFSQYGLSIMVQFRDAERLKELTAHQQSGGERSVSTALYLMALQTLTNVPFRCVDEINQGMDSNNEERMFKMLVEISTVETASQYFFLTPKLVRTLPNNKRVKYLNIINGAHVPSYNLMRADTLLRNLQASLQ